MSSSPVTSVPAADPGGVVVDWALLSKVPGRKMEYEILASTVDAGVAERCIRSVLTGHTDTRAAGRPEELPWYSFTGRLGDQPAMALMELAWSEDRDGTGQPITPARLLVTDWSDAARQNLTFSRMAEMYFGLGWHQVQTGPAGLGNHRARLPVPPGDSGVPAGDIEYFGVDFVQGIAALLLDGQQVVLTSADAAFPSLPFRIRLLDAVCALLPYAYRHQVTASTWASYRIRHRVRLTFAERAAEGQCEALLDRRSVAAPVTGDGQTYLQTLAALRAKHRTTAEIVRHLAAQRDIAACATPSDAIDLLRRMDMPASVLHNIRNGRGDVAQAGQVLTQFGWDGLESDDMRVGYRVFLVERALAGQPDAPAAWRVLDMSWSAFTADGFAPPAYAALTAGDLRRLSGIVAVVGQRPGAVLHLVRQLTDAVTRQPTAAHMATHAALLATMNVETASDEAVHALFLDRPPAGILLVSQLAGPSSHDQLRGVLRVWRPLVTEQRRWVRPVVMAVEGEVDAADPQDFAALRAAWPDGVLTVMGIAAGSGHLPSLFRRIWTELAGLGAELLLDPDDRRRSAFRAHLSVLQSRLWSNRPQWTAAEHGDAARVDLLSLLAHGVPRALDEFRDIPDSYLDALGEAWGTAEVQQVREPLRTRLWYALLPRAEGTLGVAGINDLIQVVDRVEPALRPWAVGPVSAYRYTHPQQWQNIRWTDEWRALADPYLQQLDNLATLCASDTPARQVLGALGPLLGQQNISLETLLDVIRPWFQVGRESRVLEAIIYLRFHPAASDAHRAFGEALQRAASDVTVCRQFAPGFIQLSMWLGRHGPAIAGEISREYERQTQTRPGLAQRAKGAVRAILPWANPEPPP